jgi:hypothetical protein
MLTDNFEEVWQEFDPLATGFIGCSDILPLFAMLTEVS